MVTSRNSGARGRPSTDAPAVSRAEPSCLRSAVGLTFGPASQIDLPPYPHPAAALSKATMSSFIILRLASKTRAETFGSGWARRRRRASGSAGTPAAGGRPACGPARNYNQAAAGESKDLSAPGRANCQGISDWAVLRCLRLDRDTYFEVQPIYYPGLDQEPSQSVQSSRGLDLQARRQTGKRHDRAAACLYPDSLARRGAGGHRGRAGRRDLHGLADGHVFAVAPEDGAVREVANTGGRPLGLEATADGGS